MAKHNRRTNESAQSLTLTRRALLQSALAAGGGIGLGVSPFSSVFAFQEERRATSGTGPVANNRTLALAKLLNAVKYEDLPPMAIEYAKVILASTIASAAFGYEMGGSATIVRDLAKEAGGKPESTIWFDGTKGPVATVARVNANTGDASASDDSDMRNTVHIGNTLAASGLAMAERTGASGRDLLLAMVIGYETAGRINTVMRSGGPSQGVHTSQMVSFAGAVLCSKLLKATDDQMAHALGLAALSAGGLQTASTSWGREYMGANASFTGTNAALAASRGYKGNEDMLTASGGYFEVYAGKKAVIDTLTQPIKDKPLDITRWLAIKMVPGGHGSHATAEAAVNAAKQANVSVDQIANIYIARPGGITRVDTAAPKDWVEAIHSMEYMIASAMVDKDYGFVHGTDPKIHRPEIGRVMKLIAPDPNPPAHQYPYSYGGTITIVTKSGQRFTSTVDAPRASGPRGIEWADIDKKYQYLMPLSKLAKSKIDESFKVIRAYDQVKNASELTNLLKV